MKTDLPDFRLEIHMGRWEFAARHHLTASDAETISLQELLELGTQEQRDGFRELPLGYTPTWGTDELRAAVAASYERMAMEDVLAFAGAEEGMYWALQELAGPGDHAVVTVPNYQSMESLLVATGAEVSGWRLRAEADWSVDLDELESLLRPNTTVVAVNFPNNPTGALPDPNAFRRLAELCDARGICLFSDEVYRGLELDRSRTLPQAADLSPRAVSLNVTSKSYGLPGLRVGWLASQDRDLLARLERRKHYTSICNAGPSEWLAVIALEQRERIHARNRAIISENLPLFDAFFARWPELFAWTPPASGCVGFPQYLGADGASALCQELVERAGVLLLPADVYRSELADVPTDRVRIGVGRRGAEPALEAFDAFLHAYPRSPLGPAQRR